MDQEILAELLEQAAKDAEPLVPFLAKKVATFRAALLAAQERKPTGGRTSKANQAQQLLSSSVLSTTHPARSKKIAAAAVLKISTTFAKSLEKAFRDWVVLEQAKLVLGLHEGVDADQTTRESGPLENKPDVIRFFQSMKDRDAAPYQAARLPEYKLDFIARLIVDGDEDRQHESPENHWNKLYANGCLECVRGSMGDDDQLLLAEAYAAFHMPESLPLSDRVEKRLGPDRSLDLTIGFKAAVQRILDEGHELNDAEAYAMFFANGRQFSKQTELLARLLGLSDDEKIQIQAVVSFVHKADKILTGPIVDLRLGRIKNMLARIVATFEDHKIPHSEWLPRINSSLLNEGGFIDRNLPDAETFWALLAAVLEESRTHELLQEIRVQEYEAIEAEIQRTQREYLDRMKVSYHVIENGHVIPGVPEEDDHGAVFYYRGDGVGEHLISPSAAVDLDSAASPSNTLTAAPEPDPPITSEAAKDVAVEVLKPHTQGSFTPNLFEGME